jgi:hypothetical protein
MRKVHRGVLFNVFEWKFQTWVITTRHSRKNRENGSIPSFYFIEKRDPSVIVSLIEDKVAQTPIAARTTEWFLLV